MSGLAHWLPSHDSLTGTFALLLWAAGVVTAVGLGVTELKPGDPLPETRTRVPSSTPAGMFTSSRRTGEAKPVPRQAWQVAPAS